MRPVYDARIFIDDTAETHPHARGISGSKRAADLSARTSNSLNIVACLDFINKAVVKILINPRLRNVQQCFLQSGEIDHNTLLPERHIFTVTEKAVVTVRAIVLFDTNPEMLCKRTATARAIDFLPYRGIFTIKTKKALVGHRYLLSKDY